MGKPEVDDTDESVFQEPDPREFLLPLIGPRAIIDYQQDLLAYHDRGNLYTLYEPLKPEERKPQ